MIATLTYNLPEEQESHNDALRGADYRRIIEDLCQQLRSVYKYDGPGDFGGICLKDILTADGAAKLRDALYSECNSDDLPIT